MFKQYFPEGGCTRRCEDRLDCGHRCPLKCHLPDRHENFKCERDCERRCPYEHKYCYKKCWKECGPCPVMVQRTLPDCGHDQKMTCGTKVETFICHAWCEDKLECGHKCPLRCHLDERHSLVKCKEPCERSCPSGHRSCKSKCGSTCGPCPVLVNRTLLACGHVQQMTCGTNKHTFKCHMNPFSDPAMRECDDRLCEA